MKKSLAQKLDEWSEKISEMEDPGTDFELIPSAQRLHENRAICGLMKLHSLVKEPDKWRLRPGTHEEMYAARLSEISESIRFEDLLYLVRCGMWWSSLEDTLKLW